MTSNIRLVWSNPHAPETFTPSLSVFDIPAYLELAAMLSDTRLIFDADGSVTIEVPPVCLPDERPRPAVVRA